ncbi:hypothetical protein EV138_6474 [Kribbella voronezhensis]|uniref:Uncharacterized protein n=2 Tax=Kribbella voronezhensis TaxID=2512212 RepID=A0A4R7SZ46_9ACTN|nr:hypothetical protein EV138_6474 [Kribbella voronezhensis]
MWLEECGGPDGAVVPFLELSYARGVEPVGLSLPYTSSLLLLWWESIAHPLQPGDEPGWVPAWVWIEQSGNTQVEWASLDRNSDVTPRQLVMPTSARGRSAVRKAVATALTQLTGKPTVEAAVAAIESSQHDQPTDSEMQEPTIDDDDLSANPSDNTQSEDEAWPTLPVWIWLEADEHGIWQANASLSPADGATATAFDAPMSPIGLTCLWLPVVKALRNIETRDLRPRAVPVWLWTEEDGDELVAGFSFERVEGIKSHFLDVPHDEQSLTGLREGLGAAMVWLTGCESADGAARELMKQPLSTPWSNGKPRTRVKRKPKRATKKRVSKRSSEREMVIPRIRIVSGGAPGLGKRR